MKRIMMYSIGAFLFIIMCNLCFWALVGLHFGLVEDLYRDGFVVKLKPLGRAYVFAHGSYDYGWVWNESGNEAGIPLVRGKGTCWLDAPVYHKTILGGCTYSTLDYVQELKDEGYDHVWGSWCEAGNHPYVVRYANGTEVPWPDYVSRNERPGRTIPVFWGAGFVRI